MNDNFGRSLNTFDVAYFKSLTQHSARWTQVAPRNTSIRAWDVRALKRRHDISRNLKYNDLWQANRKPNDTRMNYVTLKAACYEEEGALVCAATQHCVL